MSNKGYFTERQLKVLYDVDGYFSVTTFYKPSNTKYTEFWCIYNGRTYNCRSHNNWQWTCINWNCGFTKKSCANTKDFLRTIKKYSSIDELNSDHDTNFKKAPNDVQLGNNSSSK